MAYGEYERFLSTAIAARYTKRILLIAEITSLLYHKSTKCKGSVFTQVDSGTARLLFRFCEVRFGAPLSDISLVCLRW
jgi:hypothetical protein